MLSRLAHSRRSALLLTFALIACSESTAPNPAPTPTPTPTPTVTLTIDPANTTVTAGGSTTVTATIVRGGGFAGAVTISATGAPAGVTVTGGTIAAGATSTSITIATTAGASASSTNLSITATAAGVTTIAPATVALTVNAASGQIGSELQGEFAGDEFGTAVALSANGNRLVVGAPYNNGTAGDAGHARVFERSGNNWVQLGTDLDGEAAADRFGGAVAISDNGNRVAIGSYLNDGGGNASGHVRVFDYTGGTWTKVGADIDGSAGRGQGWAVAMNASGSRIVVGAPTPNSIAGEVKIYEQTGTAWTQLGATLAGSLETGDAVTMSDNGNRIAFSQTAAEGSTQPGFTLVYDWTGSAWVQAGATIAGEAVADLSGSSISLSGDGNMIAIGAPNNRGGGTSTARTGHVRVYRFTGGAWTQAGADIDGPAVAVNGVSFGVSVSLSSDGTRLIATGDGGGKESVGVYTLSGTTWTKATAPSFGTGGRLGDVAISPDGKTAAVGEVYFAGTAGSASGAVRLYQLQ